MEKTSSKFISDFFEIETNLDRYVFIPKKNRNDFFVYDKGIRNTAICKSNLCYVDMRDGKFYIRGKETILSKNYDFLDVAFNVIFGKDSAYDLNIFKTSVEKHFVVINEIQTTLETIDKNIHPMDFLSIGILLTSSIIQKYVNTNSREEISGFLLAQTSVITSLYFHKHIGKRPINIRFKNTFTESIISALQDCDTSKKSDELAEILNTILILHCEHGMNCSAATVRNVASAKSTIFSAISSGIAAFKGDLHGGASQRVSEMYDEIMNSNQSVKTYIDEKLASKKPLMGFGQRTYNQIANCWDPRVLTMKSILENDKYDFQTIADYRKICFEILEYTLNQDFFKMKNLTPNPDLFNCIFYKLFGVPSQMNPVMISLGRIVGWIANYYEHLDENYPLSRPCDFGNI